MIEFVNVCKTYEDNNTVALSHVNFKVDKGEFVFVVGPSGSGKSTLAKLLMYEQTPTSGEIYINNYKVHELQKKEIPYLRRSMGVVFQDFRLLPDRTVYENIQFAMQVVGASSREIRRRIPMVLSAVGLTQKAHDYPRQLSGGEQQRVSLARALANRPPLIIADEPTANLNPATALEIVEILESINDRGTTVIMATHAKDIVNKFRKRVIAIDDGRIVRDCEKGCYDDEN